MPTGRQLKPSRPQPGLLAGSIITLAAKPSYEADLRKDPSGGNAVYLAEFAGGKVISEKYFSIPQGATHVGFAMAKHGIACIIYAPPDGQPVAELWRKDLRKAGWNENLNKRPYQVLRRYRWSETKGSWTQEVDRDPGRLRLNVVLPDIGTSSVPRQ